MVRKTEGREKSTAREAQTIRSIQRLSSRLQRAITSGRSSPKLLQDVDEVVSSTFASRTEGIINLMEDLSSRDGSNFEPGRRESFLQFIPRMKNLQEILESMDHTYSSTLRGGRRVSIKDLTTLVELDSDLGASLVHLLHKCSMMRSSRRRSVENEIYDIDEILEAIDENLLTRTGLARNGAYPLSQ